MTVTLSEQTEDREQSDGSRKIGFRFVFNTGQEIRKRFLAAADFDAESGLTALVPIVEQEMIDIECAGLIADAEADGMDVFDAEPVHPETESLADRRKRLGRSALRYIIANKDIKLARKIFYRTWYYLKYESGWTAQQIATYLDISLAVLLKINSRFQWIHDNLAGLDADDAYVGEVD